MVFVKLCYGPYSAHGVIRHRSLKLHGIIGYFTEKGYEVEIEPIADLNRCIAEVRTMVVFMCDIRHLLFRMPYDEDPVAKTLIAAVEHAVDGIYSGTNVALHHIPRPGRKYAPPPRRTPDFLTDSCVNLLFPVPPDVDFEAEERREELAALYARNPIYVGYRQTTHR